MFAGFNDQLFILELVSKTVLYMYILEIPSITALIFQLFALNYVAFHTKFHLVQTLSKALTVFHAATVNSSVSLFSKCFLDFEDLTIVRSVIFLELSEKCNSMSSNVRFSVSGKIKYTKTKPTPVIMQ